MDKKPIIGIVTKHFAEETSIRPDMYIRDEVKQAVFDNGGIAIGITLPRNEITDVVEDEWEDNLSVEEREDLFIQINLCDGVIFQGGAACDYYEMIACKYCYDNNVPTLGLCCGQNVMVRVLGGTTYRIPNPEKHMRPNDKYVHKIIIDRNSKYYEIVKTTEMMVNSRHRRAVKDCPGLKKVAFCEDGYADVVESELKKFYLGVRFHPESVYKEDPYANTIFRAFIEACR